MLLALQLGLANESVSNETSEYHIGTPAEKKKQKLLESIWITPLVTDEYDDVGKSKMFLGIHSRFF